ncbi:MAG: CapA family protein [Clostridia bacterium]|nr:CapA family protein [Clostridia bacterium]
MIKKIALFLVFAVYLCIFSSSTAIVLSKEEASNEAGAKTVTANVMEEITRLEVCNLLEESLEQLYEKLKEEAETTITISFAGDCTLGTDPAFSYTNSFPCRFEKENRDFSYFFKGVKDIFQKDDLTLVNLETTLTTAVKMAIKTFRFKGDPSYVNILKEGSIEMVNIANNHIHDFLEQGFKDTLKVLDGAGIKYSGEGYTGYFEAKGIKIASLGYQGWDTSVRKKAAADMQKVRKSCNILIVSFHWGDEGSNYPNSVQTELGRFCIEQGADIVIGHHPHVIQGIEKYKGRYIVYSLGNFSFGGNHNPADKDTFIFQNKFTIKNGEVVDSESNIIPCSISSAGHVNDYQPTVLTGEAGERVLNRLKEYSRSLKFGANDILYKPVLKR